MGRLIVSIFRGIYELIEVFVLSASVFFVVYMFLGQPHQVKGNSMVPNFHDGEYLFTDKVTYRRRPPAYGDVVVFKAPINENYDFIKRVIAIAGENVMVKGGKVYVNSRQLDESKYLPDNYMTDAGQFLREGEDYTIPANNIFVMGDNRGHSSDSREWGPVPLDNLVGSAFFRYWPVKEAGLIKNPEL
ncbi:MAG: hypothetical protein ACD_58C00181G0001 [uncultured bacterium]|nr:MAG: hypothetical protein ACD_58C00181G0001 [uncultured bacterium]